MPTLKRPDVLALVYQATSKLILTGNVPTSIIAVNHSIFRSVGVRYCPKPAANGHVSKVTAGQSLMPRDGGTDMDNRFSGPSGNGAIPAAGGLYCVLQQQALVNEVRHYAKAPAHTAFADKCVLRIRLMAPFQCVDLSPHNPGHIPFLGNLLNSPGVKAALKGADLWREITDGDDCSVARGIGLAVANSVYRGLVAETVRESERSPEEKGDNVILFGSAMKEISNLYVDEAYFFDSSAHTVEKFPVQFP